MAVQRFIEEGNNGFEVFPIIDGKHAEEGTKIKGMVSFSGTISSDITNIAADDDPSYLQREKPPTISDGTVKFAGLTKEDYKLLYNNTTDSNGVLIFGRRGMAKKVGIAFNNTRVNADGTTSINRFSILNITFSLPPIETQTVKEDDDTVRAFSVPYKATTYSYTTQDGKPDRALITMVNSEDDKDIWDEVKNKLYIPDMKTKLI